MPDNHLIQSLYSHMQRKCQDGFLLQTFFMRERVSERERAGSYLSMKKNNLPIRSNNCAAKFFILFMFFLSLFI